MQPRLPSVTTTAFAPEGGGGESRELWEEGGTEGEVSTMGWRRDGVGSKYHAHARNSVFSGALMIRATTEAVRVGVVLSARVIFADS